MKAVVPRRALLLILMILSSEAVDVAKKADGHNIPGGVLARRTVDQHEAAIGATPADLTHKEEKINKLYDQLASLQKTVQRHEEHARLHEVELRRTHADKDSPVSLLQVSETKTLDEMPPEGRYLMEHEAPPSFADQIENEPQIPPPNPTNVLDGQGNSAGVVPTPDNNDHHDPDGICRNSRGDTVDCGAQHFSSETISPVEPANVDSSSEHSPGTEYEGPCVLKCFYDNGLPATAGVSNVIEFSIEIPTKTAISFTANCPRTRGGNPFTSCGLLRNDMDEKCKSLCRYNTRDASPTKPKGFGGVQEEDDEFRKYAFGWYDIETFDGCTSSFENDALSDCSVKFEK